MKGEPNSTNFVAAWTTGVTTFPGHTASLPSSTNYAWTNIGDEALTLFPFYDNSGKHYWSLKGQNSRWEMDNHHQTNSDAIYRVFIR